MSRRAAAAALAALAVTALAGCSLIGDDDGDPAPDRSPTTASSTTTAPIRPATVTVLDAGAPPRQPLRLRFTAGQRVTATVTFDLDLSQDSGAVAVLDAPPVVQQATLTVDQVDPGGASAVVSVAIDDVHVSRLDGELDDKAADAIDRQLAELEGLRGTGTLLADGRFRTFAYTVPADRDPAVATRARQMAGQVQALSVPLPAEPVGVGARWETVTSTVASGFDLRQKATYEITAIEGTTVSYTAALTQTGGEQPLPDTGSASSGRLLRSRLSGQLTGSQDLTSVGADGRSELSGTQTVAVRVGSKTTKVDQALRMTTTVESR